MRWPHGFLLAAMVVAGTAHAQMVGNLEHDMAVIERALAPTLSATSAGDQDGSRLAVAELYRLWRTLRRMNIEEHPEDPQLVPDLETVEARLWAASQLIDERELSDAHALPFADRSHDVTVLITTLEFVADPARALAEAVRVAREGIVLGVLNRWSLLAVRRRASGKAMWRCARFFGPRELALLARRAGGSRAGKIVWRTALWPIPGRRDLPLPWGGFIGLAMQLQGESKA